MEIMGKWRRLWFLWSLSAIIRTPYSSFLFQSQKIVIINGIFMFSSLFSTKDRQQENNTQNAQSESIGTSVQTLNSLATRVRGRSFENNVAQITECCFFRVVYCIPARKLNISRKSTLFSKLSSLHFIYLLKDNLQVYLHSLLSIISLLIPVLESSNNNRAIFPRKIPDFFFEFTDLFSSFERSTIFSSREVRTSATVFVSLTDSST
ncbi:Protein of unknown function, partial [Gryllus bimaculatus]